MYDPLLFRELKKDIPINVIQLKVSEATRIPLNQMLLTNKHPGARQRELVGARQLSMKLSVEYTKLSLATIGSHHGGRDHATVLHACKTVKNLIDTRDQITIENFNKSVFLIKEWNGKRTDIPKRLTLKELTSREKILKSQLNDILEQKYAFLAQNIPNKAQIVKLWIKNKVPLEIRQRQLIIQCKTGEI